jgi:hypothetical protein
MHFEPTGHALGKNESGYFYLKDETSRSKKDKKSVDKEYHQDIKKGFGGQSSSFDGLLPPYVQRKSLRVCRAFYELPLEHFSDSSALLLHCRREPRRGALAGFQSHWLAAGTFVSMLSYWNEDDLLENELPHTSPVILYTNLAGRDSSSRIACRGQERIVDRT